MIKQISNITFKVSDLKKSVHFYENILGLKKTNEWSNYVVFDVAGVILGLEPSGTKGPKEGQPDIYLLVDDVDVTHRNLKKKGVKFIEEPKDQSWGGRTAIFLDPDKYKFILVSFKK